MSKLNVDQKTIKDLFQDKKADFLITGYQIPYAWVENECHSLQKKILEKNASRANTFIKYLYVRNIMK